MLGIMWTLNIAWDFPWNTRFNISKDRLTDCNRTPFPMAPPAPTSSLQEPFCGLFVLYVEFCFTLWQNDWNCPLAISSPWGIQTHPVCSEGPRSRLTEHSTMPRPLRILTQMSVKTKGWGGCALPDVSVGYGCCQVFIAAQQKVPGLPVPQVLQRTSEHSSSTPGQSCSA